MQKKFFMGLIALTVLAVAGYGMKSSISSNVQLKDLAKANIEALANGENEFTVTCGENSGACWKLGLYGARGVWVTVCERTDNPNNYCVK
jgi:hypothetical protein